MGAKWEVPELREFMQRCSSAIRERRAFTQFCWSYPVTPQFRRTRIWHFGYGQHFDEKFLKTLPQGSVYSEPAGVDHFAQTGDTTVIVEISGYGPTDTRYSDPANDPELQPKK